MEHFIFDHNQYHDHTSTLFHDSPDPSFHGLIPNADIIPGQHVPNPNMLPHQNQFDPPPHTPPPQPDGAMPHVSDTTGLTCDIPGGIKACINGAGPGTASGAAGGTVAGFAEGGPPGAATGAALGGLAGGVGGCVNGVINHLHGCHPTPM